MSTDERPAGPADPRPAGTPAAEASIAPSPEPSAAPSPESSAAPSPESSAAPSPEPSAAASPESSAAASVVPDDATLAEIAEPAQLRRAPRIGAFITTGVLVGAVAGWLLAVLGSGTSGEARTGAILLTAAGLAALGAILGSGFAALADRRSVRRRPGRSASR
ncbi:hypothetical protein [Cellulomonas aerilata]|uniref:Uncharacterized protein n=1 Tax=Cellulomonas aerilata TaxID=515326 RepID=A0A512DEY7_9CELL|nr:hypothetical protein [Cellulomonas aerilata]GEO35044.1 hypothetical protein CAE01nite_27690 [Cellulomonas aerilata]